MAPTEAEIIDFARSHLGLHPLVLAEQIWGQRPDVALRATTEAVYALVKNGAFERDGSGAIVALTEALA